MLALVILGCSAAWSAQVSAADHGVYWVFLYDKGLAGDQVRTALSRRGAELAPHALQRRQRVRGDAGVDERDLPVHEPYVAAIEATGATVRATSRWLDAVSVEDQDQRQLLLVQSSRGAEAVQDALDQLRDLRVGKVTVREPTLEDAYVRLVEGTP